MYSKILILFFFICPINIWAQNEGDSAPLKNEIGLQIGLNNALFKDLVFSPLNYSGQGIGASLFYQRLINGKQIFITRFNYFQTIMQSGDLILVKSKLQTWEIELMYLHHLKQFDNRLDVFLGGTLSSTVNYVELEESDAAITYFNFHGLSLACRLNFNLDKKHQIISTVIIPIFGDLVRPAPTGKDNEFFAESPLYTIYTGKITSINDFFGITWTNLYKYGLSERVDLAFQIRVQYFRTAIPYSIRNMNSQLSIGTNLKF